MKVSAYFFTRVTVWILPLVEEAEIKYIPEFNPSSRMEAEGSTYCRTFAPNNEYMVIFLIF